jgi:hypothetical protein
MERWIRENTLQAKREFYTSLITSAYTFEDRIVRYGAFAYTLRQGVEAGDLGGHLKTGQLGTLQNRPVERVQDSHSFTLPVTLFARVFQVESSFGGQLGLY